MTNALYKAVSGIALAGMLGGCTMGQYINDYEQRKPEIQRMIRESEEKERAIEASTNSVKKISGIPIYDALDKRYVKILSDEEASKVR